MMPITIRDEIDVFGAPAITTKTIPERDFLNSLSGYDRNNLYLFLAQTFGDDQADQVSKLYKLGTSTHWPGASVFWQVDFSGNPRAGKIMLYDPATGKRRKDGKYITWYHSIKPRPEYVLKQCFFGEHLLNNSGAPTMIVESEKTALICWIIYPEFVWLASGSLANLSGEKCRILQGRECYLIPDENAIQAWKSAKEKSPYLTRAKILSLDYFDRGSDVADIILESLNQLRGYKTTTFERSRATGQI